MLNDCLHIVYIGRSGGASGERIAALERLGHSVEVLDPHEVVARELAIPWLAAAHARTGYRMLQPSVEQWARAYVADSFGADLVWIDGGELLGPKALRVLRSTHAPLVLYSGDGPTGRHAERRSDPAARCLPLYDLRVVPDVKPTKEVGELSAERLDNEELCRRVVAAALERGRRDDFGCDEPLAAQRRNSGRAAPKPPRLARLAG